MIMKLTETTLFILESDWTKTNGARDSGEGVYEDNWTSSSIYSKPISKILDAVSYNFLTFDMKA